VGRPRKRWKEQFQKNPGGGTDQLAQALKLLMMIYAEDGRRGRGGRGEGDSDKTRYVKKRLS
jgi:hypothetical protein